MLSSAFVVLGVVLLFLAVRWWSVVVIALICWLQNIILPWWYTRSWIDEGTARSLLVVKELLLLATLAYAAWRTVATHRFGLPAPVKWALAYCAVFALRVALGVSILGEPLGLEIRLLRSFMLPALVTIAGYLAAYHVPAIRRVFAKVSLATLLVCGVVSLLLFFLPPAAFWQNDINIALYNVNVKGDPEWTVALDLGVSGTGLGREAFAWLSSFRLIGTFGDPLTAGFNLALGAALALYAANRGLRVAPVVVLLGAATVLTFSRSAWILLAVVFLYGSLARRQYVRLGLFVAAATVIWFALSPLREFFTTSVAALQGGGGDVYHAQGVLKLYSQEILAPANILGSGPLDVSAQSASLENGYVYMIEQFGIGPVVCFIGLLVAAWRYLWRMRETVGPGGGLAAALCLATLVVSNFSFYALSFTAFYAVWVLIGIEIGFARRIEEDDGSLEPGALQGT